MELLKIKINKRKQTLTLVYNKGRKDKIIITYVLEDIEKFVAPNGKDDITLLTGIEPLYYIILKLEVLGGILITNNNIKLKEIKILNEIVEEKNVTFRTEEYKDDIYYSKYMNKKL